MPKKTKEPAQTGDYDRFVQERINLKQEMMDRIATDNPMGDDEFRERDNIIRRTYAPGWVRPE